jgi:hypothetical protein
VDAEYSSQRGEDAPRLVSKEMIVDPHGLIQCYCREPH